MKKLIFLIYIFGSISFADSYCRWIICKVIGPNFELDCVIESGFFNPAHFSAAVDSDFTFYECAPKKEQLRSMKDLWDANTGRVGGLLSYDESKERYGFKEKFRN